MECPRCKHTNISVIDSRDADCDSIRRRRECDTCRLRFTTYERIEPIKLMVHKRDGSVQVYDRAKILRGLTIATEKRTITPAVLEEITDRIEAKILRCAEDQLTSKQIGEYVIQELKELDEIAYLRFASVYQNFASLEAFETELANIKSKK